MRSMAQMSDGGPPSRFPLQVDAEEISGYGQGITAVLADEELLEDVDEQQLLLVPETRSDL